MFQFAEVENIYWLFVIPLVIGLYFFSIYRKKKRLLLFSSPQLLPQLNRYFSYPKLYFRIILISVALIFLTLTLMRPQGNPTTQTITKKGRDIFFILDISKSMLAEDIKPNRLERAKQLISDVIDILEGDRVGLIVFAGNSVLKSPLTLDYHYFKNTLRHVSINDISRGGSHIGDAIRMVSEKLFYDQDNKYRDIILITDGEDHESFPIEAAISAEKKGIRIHPVGLGSPDGANIPLRENNGVKLLKFEEKNITTRLDEETLNKIAEITHGVFVPVRTNLVDLADLYTDYIATSEKQEHESKTSSVWSELFQFFLGISILLLMIESIIGEHKLRFRK